MEQGPQQADFAEGVRSLQTYANKRSELIELVDEPDIRARFEVAALHEIGQRAESLARTIGLAAIVAGNMSQAELSRRLGVHQATVSRWLKERQHDNTDTHE